MTRSLSALACTPRTAPGPIPTRPASQVTGWAVCCDCWTGNPFQPTTWTGPVFTRVSSPDLEDLAGRRLYAPDDEVAYVAERIDVEEAVIAWWRTEPVVGAESLVEIETGAIAAARARDRLDAGVAAARRSGASWSDIGSAAGMNGQSAQERWCGVDGPSQRLPATILRAGAQLRDLCSRHGAGPSTQLGSTRTGANWLRLSQAIRTPGWTEVLSRMRRGTGRRFR